MQKALVVWNPTLCKCVYWQVVFKEVGSNFFFFECKYEVVFPTYSQCHHHAMVMYICFGGSFYITSSSLPQQSAPYCFIEIW